MAKMPIITTTKSMPLSRIGTSNVSRVTPNSGSVPIEPTTMPVNSDTSDISRFPLAMASTLTRPRKVAAKNSGWSKESANFANGGEANESSRALTRPPTALAVMAIERDRSGPSRWVIG